jgi:uncharacterized protein YbaP (TraB family)
MAHVVDPRSRAADAGGVVTSSGVESILTPEFNKNKRPVQGFESILQQFHFFADLPAKTEVDYQNLSIEFLHSAKMAY